MTLFKVGLIIDEHNYGWLVSGLADGTVMKILSSEVYVPHGAKTETQANPREFVKNVRAGHFNGKENPKPSRQRLKSITLLNLVVAVMQRNPSNVHNVDDVGVILEAEFGQQPQSVHGACSSLTRSGHVDHVGPNSYILTDKGKTSSQNEKIEWTR